MLQEVLYMRRIGVKEVPKTHAHTRLLVDDQVDAEECQESTKSSGAYYLKLAAVSATLQTMMELTHNGSPLPENGKKESNCTQHSDDEPVRPEGIRDEQTWSEQDDTDTD